MKFEFSRQISEKYSTSNFMKIRPVGAELFHADGRTDGQTDRYDDASNRFRNFANVPERSIYFGAGLNYIQEFSSYFAENS
jgi:hypothetical protein